MVQKMGGGDRHCIIRQKSAQLAPGDLTVLSFWGTCSGEQDTAPVLPQEWMFCELLRNRSLPGVLIPSFPLFPLSGEKKQLSRR